MSQLAMRPDARVYYRLVVTSSPALPGGTAILASFDRGSTWIAGEADPDVTGALRWLLAGSQAVQGDAVAVIADSTLPLLSCDVGDEHLVWDSTVQVYIQNY